jgi:hypothetical protein
MAQAIHVLKLRGVISDVQMRAKQSKYVLAGRFLKQRCFVFSVTMAGNYDDSACRKYCRPFCSGINLLSSWI